MGSARVTNFSDLIQRVTANCLLHPLGCSDRFERENNNGNNHHLSSSSEEEDEEEERERESEFGSIDNSSITPVVEKERGQQQNGGHKRSNKKEDDRRGNGTAEEEVEELAGLMSQVFDSVSAMKRAYVEFQGAHSPWDPARMRAADEAVVSQLRRIGVFRERFKRRGFGGGGGRVVERETMMVREVVAPYEAVVEDMRKEVKAKEEQVEMLKERLKRVGGGRNNGGGRSKRKGNGKDQQAAAAAAALSLVPLTPSPELFESTMMGVRKSVKSFASLLLSLMRSAKWDISAAVRSIESAAAAASLQLTSSSSSSSSSPTAGSHHARYALESYVTGKLFQGFDHETFYMDGTLHSLLDPANFRRDCFSKFLDMRSMDPTELLGVTPTCQFGGFCAKKYLAIMHPKMEESLLGDLEHRRRVSAGEHPRTEFYGEFLAAAKAVWLLHLMAFALDPVPTYFEAARGAEFRPEYMESVVRLPSANGVMEKLLPGFVVGLPVSPGFKLANNNGSGSVIKARVFLGSRAS